MVGAVVENLSNGKLLTLLGCLLCAQIVFFLLGGLIAPQPSTSMEFLMTKCFDGSLGEDKSWFFLRPGGHCDSIDFGEDKNPEILLEVRMGYRSKTDNETIWSEFVNTRITRLMDCDLHEDINGGCSPLELFELGSNDYPFYLLNIRVPSCNRTRGMANCNIGHLNDMRVIAIHQNGGFTAVWLAMKTMLCPCVFMVLLWYINRLNALHRPPLLLEKCIVVLGTVMLLVDLPVEWFSLIFKMPFLLLLSDIRQGLFYAVLFSFWLIFTGEHQTEDTAKNRLSFYWKHLTAVICPCICMFIFDMCERGVHLTNPFYSIWATNFGTNLAYMFIIVAAISAAAYFLFLTFSVVRVINSIKRKRASLNSMTNNRRLKFQGIIYRFKFLMGLTLVCAGLTVAGFMMDQLRWGDYEDSPSLNYSSAFLTGIFGMWNIYVLLLMAMYAPSHKQYHLAAPMTNDDDTNSEDTANDTRATYNVVADSAVLTTLMKTAHD